MTKHNVNDIVEIDNIDDTFIIKSIDKIYLGENRFTDILTIKSIFNNKTLTVILDAVLDDGYLDVSMIHSLKINSSSSYDGIYFKNIKTAPTYEYLTSDVKFDNGTLAFSITFDKSFIGSISFYLVGGSIYRFELLDTVSSNIITLQKLPLSL